jgi:hypothetical protein
VFLGSLTERCGPANFDKLYAENGVALLSGWLVSLRSNGGLARSGVVETGIVWGCLLEHCLGTPGCVKPFLVLALRLLC